MKKADICIDQYEQTFIDYLKASHMSAPIKVGYDDDGHTSFLLDEGEVYAHGKNMIAIDSLHYDGQWYFNAIIINLSPSTVCAFLTRENKVFFMDEQHWYPVNLNPIKLAGSEPKILPRNHGKILSGLGIYKIPPLSVNDELFSVKIVNAYNIARCMCAINKINNGSELGVPHMDPSAADEYLGRLLNVGTSDWDDIMFNEMNDFSTIYDNIENTFFSTYHRYLYGTN